MKIEKLKQLRACHEAIIYSAKFKTPKEAWESCPRGDWMLWIAENTITTHDLKEIDEAI